MARRYAVFKTEVIKAQLKAQDISQERFAKMLGVSKSLVSLLLCGRRSLSLAILSRTLCALNLTWAWGIDGKLIYWVDDPPYKREAISKDKPKSERALKGLRGPKNGR